MFTQTIASATKAAATLAAQGVESAAIHSKLARDERSTILRRLADGGLKAIAAPKVLDEGVDVREADLAIIVAASHQRRQMIQRMGRVLRRKLDGRRARFAVLFVEGTSEDPERGAHESFLDEVLQVADESHQFEVGARASDLAGFLRPD